MQCKGTFLKFKMGHKRRKGTNPEMQEEEKKEMEMNDVP